MSPIYVMSSIIGNMYTKQGIMSFIQSKMNFILDSMRSKQDTVISIQVFVRYMQTTMSSL